MKPTASAFTTMAAMVSWVAGGQHRGGPLNGIGTDTTRGRMGRIARVSRCASGGPSTHAVSLSTADRHLRADPYGVLADAGEVKAGVILVQVSLAMAGALGVQHLTWMLVSLLSRQFKVVKEIVLDVPEVALHAGVAPFGAKATLVETLEECVRLVSGPHVTVGVGASSVPDMALVIGDATPAAPWHWRLYADGWRYFVGIDGELPATAPKSGLSIGPYLCAAYAAGEVFKLLRGMKPGKGEFIRTHLASAWTMSCAETWSELVDGPGDEAFGVLPHFYFAGAGAVAQAAALCLGSSALTGACTTVDEDNLDLTNDNRYALSTRDDDGASKVELLQRYPTTRRPNSRPASRPWRTALDGR